MSAVSPRAWFVSFPLLGRVRPGGKIPFPAGDRNQGFNAVLSTTHRQNFLVPPRRHGGFPLAEV